MRSPPARASWAAGCSAVLSGLRPPPSASRSRRPPARTSAHVLALFDGPEKAGTTAIAWATPPAAAVALAAQEPAVLKTWLMAVHIVTSHSNGISALQLQAQLGLGSYKSAWLLLHKLRRAMVDPDRSLLEDLVEIDEATLPFRTVKDPTTGGQGRSRQGKMRIAGAVELSPEGEPRRIRLAPIGDFSARSLHAFVAGTSAPGARVITDGWSGYPARPRPPAQGRRCNARPRARLCRSPHPGCSTDAKPAHAGWPSP